MNWSIGYEEEETRTSRWNQIGTERRSRMECRSVNENWRKGRLKELTQIHTLT